MKFKSKSIYHLYNRGNNRQKIFLNEANYKFFINKIKREICPFVDLIAYCLMPNHYHLMFAVKKLNDYDVHRLTRKLGTLQSSYTRAINLQENRTGSLFQQKAKSVEICTISGHQGETDYLTTCFHYIHYNPYKAGLVNKHEDWKFSSYNEYAGISVNKMINESLAKEMIEIDWDNIYEETYKFEFESSDHLEWSDTPGKLLSNRSTREKPTWLLVYL
jgi:putative transposase